MFSAVERTTGLQFAVKAIHNDWLDRRRVEFLRAEIDIHREASSHPYVVPMLGVFYDPEACYIVQELAQGGSLLEHLHSRESMGTEGEVSVLGYRFCGDRRVVLGTPARKCSCRCRVHRRGGATVKCVDVAVDVEPWT